MRNPLHNSKTADRYLPRKARCNGQLRRLYLTLWETAHHRRLHAVGWACSKCGQFRPDRDALAELEQVPTGGGAVALRLRSSG